MSKPRVRVAIVGAGLGGLAAAIGIARAGHDVTIIEQAAVLGDVGSGIQVPPNSSRILGAWDVLDQIKDAAFQPIDFTIRRYADGQILSVSQMVPLCIERYRAPYLHIHRADYHRTLTEKARALGVKIQLDSPVVGIDFNEPSLRIKDKADVHVDLIIGADGLKSVCRETLLGRPDPPHLTGDLAYRITISLEEMARHPELADLVREPRMTYWAGPHAHVVGYPLKRGSVYNIVLACPDDLPAFVQTAKADIDEMNVFFENWDPKLRRLLSMVKETTKWRLQNSEEMEQWMHPSGKFVLLGDACHATLPYMAQGAAMAVEDGAVLGALMGRLEAIEQIPEVLTMYEKIRKPRTSRVVKRSTAAGKVFHMPDGKGQRERDRQLLDEEPFEGYPNHWNDPELQPWLFGYDVEAEVERAWQSRRRD